MPAIADWKKEQFAQLLADGKTPAEAYSILFPRSKVGNRNSARYLKENPEIIERMREIMDRAAEIKAKALAKAQDKAAVDRAYVLRNLKEIVERCMQHKPVTDANGDPVFVETPTGKIAAAYTFRPEAAVSALKLLGTELGMFIQRHAVVDDPFAALPAQLVREIVESLSRLKEATRVIEHEPADRPLLADQPAS